MDDEQPQVLPPAYPDRAAWGTAASLRAWQTEAVAAYREAKARDFLVVATPGAGKTTFALTIARMLLDARLIERVTVVTPTEHLKTQWANAADAAGIALDPEIGAKRAKTAKGFTGIAVTYAGVAANPLALRVRTERFKTLVILDEIHHAGDARSWGDAVVEAFGPAKRRLALTGTPFRSDDNPIPFVTYEPVGDGTLRSRADYTYGYAHALSDHVVRPVLFMAYSGDLRWRTRAGDEIAARLGEPLTKDLTAQALRTALDPNGAWIPAVLQAADTRLSEVRKHMPDAGGLVIASDTERARAYAATLRSITGKAPVIVLSDEKASSRKIAKFAESDARWLVAVRMVSEGVDVPRLAVGVYATTTGTPLFFAQAVGRFLRARRRDEIASVFVPSVPATLSLAAAMEVERDHAIGKPAGAQDDDPFAAEQALLDRANAAEAASDELLGEYAAVSSEASFDRVVYDGGDYGSEAGSDAELDYLGLPGLLEPDQVRTLLTQRQSKLDRAERGRQRADGDGADGGDRGDELRQLTTHEELSMLRRELNGLVGAWHHRTGRPHGAIHAELRRDCGGPSASHASGDELRTRIDRLRDWAAARGA